MFRAISRPPLPRVRMCAKSTYTMTTTLRPRGNILLLALLLLAGGLVGGLTVATLVVADLRQATAIDNGLIAYATAESGLEKSLYDIRQADYCNQPGKCDQTNATYADCSLSVTTSGNANQVATCNRKISPAAVVLQPYLLENQTFQMDFNPALDASLCPGGECTFTVTWGRDVAVSKIPSLEVSYVDSFLGKLRVYRPYNGQPYNCSPDASGACVTITPTDISSKPLIFPNGADEAGSSLYQVRFRALGAPITNLKIISNAINVSGYLDVWSRGTQSGATQTLETIVPKRAPAYGFADYVIFSEQDINK